MYSEEWTGRGPSPPMPLLAVPNVTAHPSTASVPITILLYNGPLLCGFNVPVKGLTRICYSCQASTAVSETEAHPTMLIYSVRQVASEA